MDEPTVEFVSVSSKFFYLNFEIAFDKWIHVFKFTLNEFVEKESGVSIYFWSNSTKFAF